MSRYLACLVSVVLCGIAIAAGSEEAVPSYLSSIGASEKRVAIETIRAEAHVTVSDGLEYDVVTVFHDHQRGIFYRRYADTEIALGVEGKYYWSFDGEKEVEPYIT